MLEKILGVSSESDRALSPEKILNSPDKTSSASPGNQNLEGKVLVNAGIISQKTLDKLESSKTSDKALRLLRYIESSQEDKAKKLALSSAFIQENPKFVESGVPVKTATSRGLETLVNELIQNGYYSSPRMLFEGISQCNDSLVTNVVQFKIHSLECINLSIWYLLYAGYYSEAHKLFAENPDLDAYRGVLESENESERVNLLSNTEIVRVSMKEALGIGEDFVASVLVRLNPLAVTMEMVHIAKDNHCIEFLERIWTGDYRSDQVNKRRKSSKIWKVLCEELGCAEPSPIFEAISVVSYIKELLAKKHKPEAQKVLKWPEVNQEGVVSTLIELQQEDLAIGFLENIESVSEEEFTLAFSSKLYSLCVEMLAFEEPVLCLRSPQVQEQLIGLLKKGETCLQALEMLNAMEMKFWCTELTSELCSIFSKFVKKTQEIVVCPAPLLYCALTAEFLEKLSEVSLEHQNKCLNTARLFKQLGASIENYIQEELELRYFLLQKDSQGRSVLTILAENNFFEMLENDEIGTIVSKMWAGSEKNYPIQEASSIYKSCSSPSSSEEAMQFAKRTDRTKSYVFQYSQWTQSCSLRFLPYSFACVLLVVFYQMLIYAAISANAFNDLTLDQETFGYLLTSVVLIGGVAVERFLQVLFCWRTKGEFQVDRWVVVDLLIFLGITEVLLGFTESLSSDTDFAKSVLHSIIVTLIWLRFCSVLIITKSLGTLLRMIYLMIIEIRYFIVIFLFLVVGSSGIFTAILRDSSGNYTNYNLSLANLYSGALGGFSFEVFDKNKYLGWSMFGFYMLVANVMFLNLLIALLSNVYSELNSKVDSQHRAVIVSYYNKFYWDQNFGFLLFLPTPLSYLGLLFSPVVLFAKNPQKWNVLLTKCFYLFYAIPQFCVFLVYSLLYFPVLYFKGFKIYSKSGKNQKLRKEVKIFDVKEEETNQENLQGGFSWPKAVLWGFIGVFWILFALFRDSYDFWVIAYISASSRKAEKSYMSEIVDDYFVETLKRTLNAIEAEELSVQQLFDTFEMFYKSKKDANIELAKEFLNNLADSTNNLVVQTERAKKLCLKKSEGAKESKKRIRHINVPWVLKALKKFRQQIGSSSYSVENKAQEETPQTFDSQEIEEIEAEVKDLDSKYSSLLEETQLIKQQMENQIQNILSRSSLASSLKP